MSCGILVPGRTGIGMHWQTVALIVKPYQLHLLRRSTKYPTQGHHLMKILTENLWKKSR